MRASATGKLHLGHFHGVLKNWLRLQHEHECFFFVADWHALTTDYENPQRIGSSIRDMIIDWLAAGVDPKAATLFIQSAVPEHAELHLLLSMCTPLSWLERVPTYKDQQEKLKDKDLSTYGFLGYPLLQSADILIYKAMIVPVGEDQVAHIELTREIARRFNHLYGKEADFVEKMATTIKSLGKDKSRVYVDLRKRYQEQGDHQALTQARELLASHGSLKGEDRERLAGYLEGEGRVILPEPQAWLTPASKMPGLDGQKMSKSYGNTLGMREDPQDVTKKIRTMPTDPARIRRTDAGDPDKCPVWQFHKIYSNDDVKNWVQAGCRSAGIGCIECKQPVIDAVIREQQPFRERAEEFMQDPTYINNIIKEGCERARAAASATLEEVRRVMGLRSF